MKKPKKLEKPEIKKIEIVPVLNGYEVSVGCQEIVFTDDAEMIKYLSAYLYDPKDMELLYGETMAIAIDDCPPARDATSIDLPDGGG